MAYYLGRDVKVFLTTESPESQVSVANNAVSALGGGASSLAVAGICTAATFVPTVGQLGNRNLIINGDMQIAQRNVSSNSVGYKTIDRMYGNFANTDEAPTFAQVDVTADTPAWNAGFRKAFKITNGNQTGGAGAADAIQIQTSLEAQDIANSGWNYTSSSSFVTLSFWIKSSVAQNFYFYLELLFQKITIP